ncbi:MAG: chorismate synthase [Chlamydiota bacterium]|jgi:chorismate synthase
MASNSFGSQFRITTFGESHGKFVGVIIDGCPSKISLTEGDINLALALRRPGNNSFVSPRKEEDKAIIVSGVFEGKTTGAPITILVENKAFVSSAYQDLKNLYRPSHANYTYLNKYGVFDHNGSGRASARETVARVAAGAVANKILQNSNITLLSFLKQVGPFKIEEVDYTDPIACQRKIDSSPIFCPDEIVSQKIENYLLSLKEQGDSSGAIVEFIALNVPIGLGDPIYEKLEANLAKAMLSIPASKGFEVGDGFILAEKKGSESNDGYDYKEGNVSLTSNHSGGILGGISNGMPIIGRVCFKPTSSIKKHQNTVDFVKNENVQFTLSSKAKHDPCVGIRAVIVVRAMLAIALADSILMNQAVQLNDKNNQKSAFSFQ